MATYPLSAPPKVNWFAEHWKLVIAFAIGGCFLVAAAICLFVVGIFSILGNSDACKLAVAQAQKSPAVIERLGTPIERGRFVSGNVNVQAGGTGRAELSIPLHGPKGEGTLYVEARKRSGVWSFGTLEFSQKGDATALNLLSETAKPPEMGTF